MKLTDFQYDLPDHLIARVPTSQRSESRLLTLTESVEHKFTHLQFKDIVNLLNPDDLLVFNDTKVIPARLFGQRKTGGKVEVLVERCLDIHNFLAQIRCNKKPTIGEILYFPHDIEFVVKAREQQFYNLYSPHPEDINTLFEKIGEIPLPPYMHRRPTADDSVRYQTVYARHKGSVAAPTAGLHFDETLLAKLEEKRVQFAFLTLHIGAGTFAPVRTENITDHHMHAEYFEISAEVCDKIAQTRAKGGRVIAVGTTSLRALEAASVNGHVQVFSGQTQIFIYPGYQFQCVDALITNLHLPASTLLMLVCAFGGYETMMKMYAEAVKKQYRFYSYGDAMFVERG